MPCALPTSQRLAVILVKPVKGSKWSKWSNYCSALEASNNRVSELELELEALAESHARREVQLQGSCQSKLEQLRFLHQQQLQANEAELQVCLAAVFLGACWPGPGYLLFERFATWSLQPLDKTFSDTPVAIGYLKRCIMVWAAVQLLRACDLGRE